MGPNPVTGVPYTQRDGGVEAQGRRPMKEEAGAGMRAASPAQAGCGGQGMFAGLATPGLLAPQL